MIPTNIEKKIIPLSNFGVDESILAHSPKETLIEHSNLTIEYLYKIFRAKNLEKVVDNLLKKIEKKNFDLLKEIFINSIYLHDVGKKNPYFQAKKMKNSKFKEYLNCSESSNHSFLSSQEFIEFYLPKFSNLERKTKEKFKFLLYSFSYSQAKHHSRLGTFEEYRRGEIYWNYLDRFDIPPFEFFILNRLLFSLLISSDYYATIDYMSNLKIDDFGLISKKDREDLIADFQNYIKKFSNPSGINKIRNQIRDEALENLKRYKDKNIFYLEAPTGSGKTLTSVNLSLYLLKSSENLNKLFYIFPFNTIVEQTKGVFDEIFQKLDVEVINSITPMKEIENQEEEETKYQKSYINRLFFHSKAIITTHISLFNILFGTTKEATFPLWQLSNSIIIIDEIQSYDNNLWWYIVEFFEKYAENLNIKIIIMSATLPKLDYFLEKRDNFIDLIPHQKRNYFFQNSYFKNRVEIDFSLLNREIDLKELEEFFIQVKGDYQKILFEFITKTRAREFYNQIRDKYDNVYELSGDDNRAYRKFLINKIEEKKAIIVISTQVIEAGVDIDMDLGFKDISTLDSEEQFLGRINRSCKKGNAKVYFFNLDNASIVYKGDNRLNFNLTNPKYREILKNKNYRDYYDEVLKVIKKNGEKFNGIISNREKFIQLVKKLNYREIEKEMQLINSQTFNLYFPFKIDISKYEGVKEFENIDSKFLTDGKLDGLKVWNEFKLLDTIQGFAERKYKKSIINSLMQFFTFSIIKYNSQKLPPYFNEEYRGYFFINDLKFITKDNKFDRRLYQKESRELFL